jgi:RHS repeat-associated protein
MKEIMVWLQKLIFGSVITLSFANTSFAFESVYIKGSANVDQFGAANYNIPIELPPGVAGFQPNLTLSYSSFGQNSYIGMGWSLSGMPAISRCPSTFSQDGYANGVNLDVHDQFCLDGSRLFKVRTGEYRTEKESYTRIFSFGTTGTGPSYFVAYTKNGRKMIFGNTADSKVIAQSNPNVVIWAANEISDLDSNYYKISYFNDSVSGQYYPKQIDFTGNSTQGTTPTNSIKFFYEAKPDKSPLYRSNIYLSSTSRLANIKTYTNGFIVYDYQFSYQQSPQTGRSLLVGLNVVSGDQTKSLLPTSFNWNGPSSTYTATVGLPVQRMAVGATVPVNYITGGIPTTSAKWYSGDFNGDGISDILEVDAGATDARVCYSHYAGTVLDCYKYNLGMTVPAGGSIVVGDFDGDGFADFAQVKASTTSAMFCFSRTSGFLCNTVIIANLNTGGSAAADQIFAADMDGDGLTDIIQVPSSPNLQPKICRIFMLTNPTGECSTMSWVSNFSPYNVVFGDFNGDGIQDIAFEPQPSGTNTGLPTDGVMRVCYSDSVRSQYFNPSCENKYTFPWILRACTTAQPCGYEYFSGDFNGDGVTDIAQFTNTTGINAWAPTNGISINFSTGKGVAATVSISSFINVGDHLPFFIGDLNGDGKADIITKETTGNTEICYSRGDGSFDCAVGPSITDPRTIFGNFTGDTNIAIMSGDSQGINFQIYKNPILYPDLLTSIQTGIGGTTTYTYKTLTDGIHTKSTGSVYPQKDVQPLMWVVATKNQDNGNGGQRGINYTYSGAKSDLSGRGYLGFANVTETDISASTVLSTDYNQSFPLTGSVAATHKGVLLSSKNITRTVSENFFKYKYDILNYTAPFQGTPTPIFLVQKQEVTYDLGTAALVTNTASNYQYDDSGNLVSETISTHDGYSTQKTYVVKNFTGDPTINPANWYLGQVMQVQQKNLKPDGKSITKTRAYTYNSNHHLTQEKIEPTNLTTYLTTDINYDGFGNVISKSISGSGLPLRSETYTFDSIGQFSIAKTNSYGQTASFSYDPKTGQPISMTDLNSLTKKWSYDVLGRKSVETSPDGTKISISYNLCTSTKCAPGQTYYIKSSKTGGATQILYFDNLDREIVSQISGARDKWIYKYKYYDNIGNVSKVSTNTNGQPQYFTKFAYDQLNRVISETAPDSSQKTIAYDDLTITTKNNNGFIKKEIKDSSGRLVKVTDDSNKSIIYDYDAFGNLIKTTDSKGNVINIAYDILDHKISNSDGDSGASSFSYNAVGELLSTTDANGNTTTSTFDNLGRMLTQVTPEGTSTWIYDTAAHGVGKIASASRTNGYAKTYTYDSLSRPTNVQVTMDTTYNISTTYDSFSRVSQLNYPTGFGVKYKYDSFGHVIEIDNAATNALLWKVTNANANNNPLSETFGNNITTVKTYYPDTGRLQRSLATTSSGSSVQDLSFTYDYLGNVTSRNELINQTTGATLLENFSYDNLNRLTSVSSPNSKTITYDELGNIITKSDVGTYTYGTGSPGSPLHAVMSTTGATTFSFTYDNNGNMLTGNGRTATWASFNKPLTIANANNTINFYYDTNLERYKEVASTCKDYHGTTSSTCVKYLINPAPGTGIHFEKETNGSITTNRHYLYAGANNNIIGVYTTRSDGTNATNYFHKDNLGTVNVITDAGGLVTERVSFDAFGKRRNVNGSDDPTNAIRSLATHQGFTLQEHLDDGGLGLVHMNGRIYEPLLGRFMGADPIITEPTNMQSLNRFSYVINNPLNLKDPSGYSWVSEFFSNPGSAVSSFVTNLTNGNAIGGFAFGGDAPKAVGYFIALAFPLQSVPLLNTTNLFQSNFEFTDKDKSGINSYYIAMASIGAVATGFGAGEAAYLVGSSIVQSYLTNTMQGGNYLDQFTESLAVNALLAGLGAGLGGSLQVGNNFGDLFLKGLGSGLVSSTISGAGLIAEHNGWAGRDTTTYGILGIGAIGYGYRGYERGGFAGSRSSIGNAITGAGLGASLGEQISDTILGTITLGM